MMKAKKTVGIIAVAVMGLMAVAWAADTAAATGQAQVDKGTVCTYDAHDNGSCGHWYRWLPGHRERCGWSNCGSWSRGCR